MNQVNFKLHTLSVCLLTEDPLKYYQNRFYQVNFLALFPIDFVIGYDLAQVLTA